MESGWGIGEKERCIRVLCPSKIAASCKEPGLCWLIGSPSFLPPFTIVSSLRCLHSQPDDDPYSPDVNKEADDLRTLLLRGLDVVGALYVGNQNSKENARKAVEESHRLRQMLSYHKGTFPLIGAIADLGSADIQFSISEAGNSKTLEVCSNVVYEDCSEKYMWELGCLLRSELTFKLPVYVPVNRTNAEELFSCVIDAAASKLRDPQVVYLVEGANATSLQPVVLHGKELDFNIDLLDDKIWKNTVTEDSRKTLSCSSFLKSKCTSSSSAMESADIIHVSVLCNQSGNPAKSSVPIAEYCPASVPARLVVVNIKLDVLCYASKDFSVASAVSKLIIPGLVDQLATLKKAIIPKLLTQHPRLSPYHFFPPGILHPITAIYDLSSGEMEMPQAEIRRSLHLRLGLPLDRPLLLTANALTFGTKVVSGSNFIKNGSSLIKDVHTEIASSGVSGGLSSLVEGSYEYYHYLQDSFDDSGWGCAYRSLQTIISWFRLQQYTSIEVPSHRGIQKALVEIGDKDPSFVGSREWIGAIELSFVLDKLLGVSCKIINVRSGAELPEKCRELALHFETQGTPVMIGGGVLAYTLLGVDYNDVSGDCAFLILDPHYTGNDEVKRIVNGGWCGWKKAVDSKGRNFFLHDKFYNLLLPQRPNMV